jgi:hypothetical protein
MEIFLTELHIGIEKDQTILSHFGKKYLKKHPVDKSHFIVKYSILKYVFRHILLTSLL